MQLVEQHIISKNKKEQFKKIDHVCFLSKNLYNAALYFIKQEYEKSGRVVRYAEIEKNFRENKQNDYFALPNNSSQQILRILDKNIKSYFALLKKWKKNKTSLNGCPKFLHYKHKTKGRNIVVFTCNQFSRKGNTIHFPKKSNLLPIQTKIEEGQTIDQIRLIPKSSNYTIEIVYSVQEVGLLLNDNKASIDLGLNNFSLLSLNNSNQTFAINGRGLKSINHYYNKKKAKLISELTKKHPGRHSSNKLVKLTNKRNNKIKDYLHKSSKIIVDVLIKNNTSELAIGLNKEWKQSINIGKKNNQNFVSIPHTEFIEQLKYKCRLKGINVLVSEESYTSKCSSLDLEPIKKNESNSYLGKRIHRGMFIGGTGIKINADLNGSLNIGRKVFGDEFVTEFIANKGYGQYPIRVNSNKYISI